MATTPLTREAIETGWPVCVDLDGTLVTTDTLWECLLSAWSNNYWLILAFPYWLLRGKAYLKAQAAKHAAFDAATLCYDEDLLSWLREQRMEGRAVLLVTGASERVANEVADHLGFFSEVISSNDSVNLTGANKLKMLASRFPDKKFEYVGDSRADLPIWNHLGRAHVRGASRGFCKRLERSGVEVVSQERHRSFDLRTIARELRVHQWAKNLLIFIPVLASHRVVHAGLLVRSLLAFAAFSFVASSFYVFNDLIDVRADRQHPVKRERPLAAGKISMGQAGVLMLVCMAIGLGLAAKVSLPFLGCTLLYLLGTATYSLYAKRLMLVDAFVLGVLYTMRVIAGGVATHITISSWTLGYTSFLFLSLALMKRYSELSQRASELKALPLPGRAYQFQDLAIIGNIGVSSGLVSALMMALYLRSPEVEVLYRHPAYLLPLCIIHVYWISRAWVLTNRHLMHDDPIVFALKDGVTHKLVLLAAVIGYFAT